MGSILGNRVKRVEDPRFLTIGGRYVDDVRFDDEAHVAFVRSPYAHATIQSIDLDDALSSPGVLRVFTAADLDGKVGDVPAARPGIPDAMTQVILASDRVRYVGQAVCAVVAESAAQAADAVDLVFVDYEPLQVVVDVEVAATDETLLFPEAGSNAVVTFQSPARADFADCEVIVEERIVNQRLSGAPMEARAGLARWTDDGRLEHYSACQGAHPTRALLCTLYNLDASQVRVVVPDMGGGFGVKSRTYPDEAGLGFFARAVGRPVRWAETRSENFLAMPQGRGQVQYAKLGGTREGRITAYQLDVVQDAGAYPMTGSVLHGMTMRMLCGVYDIGNVGFTGTSWVTNMPSITAYRGAGRPEAAVAIERMVDRYAAEIDMDPADVRRINLIPRFTEPITTGIGTPYDVGDFPRSLELVLDAAGYEDLRTEQRGRRERGDAVQIGIGVATYVEITAGVGGSEYGAVELQSDGSMVVRTGATPYGQGHVTTWSMIVADRTGVAVEDITVVHGDTDQIRTGGLTVGSRSVQLGGSAIAAASAKLVEAGRDRAAELLEAASADVVLDTDGGAFHVAGTPARRVTWSDVAEAVDAAGEPLTGDHDFEAPMPTFPFGAHVAVVEVDTETGHTRLVRLVACDDAGTLINPLIAEGQVHGGIAQGVAQAMMEEIVYDVDGNPKTTNFAEYPVISSADLPSFQLVSMETPTWVNELGAKGVGESGTIGAIPATYNAIIDAVSHLGVRHLVTPCTPERIWAAIMDAKGIR